MSPPPIILFAVWASLITIARSVWELSRMIKKKLAEQEVKDKARIIYYNLQEAHRYGLMSDRDYDYWYMSDVASGSNRYCVLDAQCCEGLCGLKAS
ncbi:hypothetical protein V8F06_014795 [Rhypophila decipiens]